MHHLDVLISLHEAAV